MNLIALTNATEEMLNAEISIIGIIIVVVVWVLSWLFKKKEESQFELPPELKSQREKASPPPAARSWEEELRRILEDRPAPAPPPPLVREVSPPPRVYTPPPPPLEVDEPHIQVTFPTLQPRIERTFQPLQGLTEAAHRYGQALSLEERVSRHMGNVTTHRVGTTSVLRRELSPGVRDVLQGLRTPSGVRSAVIAQVILGPPRALEGV
ncbi:MAG TPA: hypothetical protein VK846_18425 [Candidatus Limnocylindria bacterium]|nr:hypothetical protein [Candidatus Limnocylindria bacterium]